MMRKRWKVLMAVAGVIVAVAVVGAWWRRSARVHSAAIASRRALAERRFDDARLEIERWEKLAPRSGEPPGALAQLELSLEHPEQAFAAIKRAAELGCDEKTLRVIRAISQ